jgi:Rrf2 family protein
MKLTRASSYALHAVAYMAEQKIDRPMASHKIAHARGIPERFLLKVLKPLVAARLLMSIKGPNGGYRLARPASNISILEVIEAVEGGEISGQAPPPEPEDEVKYPGYKPVHAQPVYNKLDDICKQTADVLRKNLDKVRVSDLASAKKDAGEGKRKSTKSKTS